MSSMIHVCHIAVSGNYEIVNLMIFRYSKFKKCAENAEMSIPLFEMESRSRTK